MKQIVTIDAFLILFSEPSFKTHDQNLFFVCAPQRDLSNEYLWL